MVNKIDVDTFDEKEANIDNLCKVKNISEEEDEGLLDKIEDFAMDAKEFIEDVADKHGDTIVNMVNEHGDDVVNYIKEKT